MAHLADPAEAAGRAGHDDASSTVPMANDTSAACQVPTALPSMELIGAWSAIEAARARGQHDGQAAVHAYFASSQFGPMPASTASGGSSSHAATHLAHTISRARSASLGRALEQQLVVDLEDQPRLQPGLGERVVGSAPSPPS